MCEQVGGKVGSFYLRKSAKSKKRVKIRETAHTQGSVVFHGPSNLVSESGSLPQVLGPVTS